jgi:hypothetical protein
VSLGVSGYEALSLYQGRRIISSKGTEETNLKVHQLVIYCSLGVIAGIVGGLLGLGGGFIMGPLFLELGIPPQVLTDPNCLYLSGKLIDLWHELCTDVSVSRHLI